MNCSNCHRIPNAHVCCQKCQRFVCNECMIFDDDGIKVSCAICFDNRCIWCNECTPNQCECCRNFVCDRHLMHNSKEPVESPDEYLRNINLCLGCYFTTSKVYMHYIPTD